MIETLCIILPGEKIPFQLLTCENQNQAINSQNAMVG